MDVLETLKSKPVAQTNKYIKIKTTDCSEEKKEGEESKYIIDESKDLTELEKGDQDFIEKVKKMNQLTYKKYTPKVDMPEDKGEETKSSEKDDTDKKDDTEIEGEQVPDTQEVPNEERIEIEKTKKWA